MNATQTTAKKTWSKPQILVLLRSKPEEAVLISCKHGGTNGPGTGFGGCIVYQNECIECAGFGLS